MQDQSSIPLRVNDLEQKIHTLEHRTISIEKAIDGVPGRMLLIEHQIAQIKNLEDKIDRQASSISSLKDTVLESVSIVKRNIAYISGAAGVIIFLAAYGDKLLKLLDKGAFL